MLLSRHLKNILNYVPWTVKAEGSGVDKSGNGGHAYVLRERRL
jgi:hypothetical protein